MSKLLIDTDVLIDVSRGEMTAVNRLVTESTTLILWVSAITEMEMIVGCRNKSELRILDGFLASFEVIPIYPAISSQASNLLRTYRLSHGLLIPDALIAATAIESDIPLLSKNQKDFRFITELSLLPYP